MNKVDIDVVDSAGPAVSKLSRQIREAIRTLKTEFGGALQAVSVLWMPFSRRGACEFKGFYEAQTSSATQKRLAQYLLRDNAVSDVTARITGRSTANNGYSVSIQVTYKRVGTTVAIVGGGAVTKTGEREDVAGWDSTISTVTVGSDVYLLVLVTGAASTTADWSCVLTVQEQPTQVST